MATPTAQPVDDRQARLDRWSAMASAPVAPPPGILPNTQPSVSKGENLPSAPLVMKNPTVPAYNPQKNVGPLSAFLVGTPDDAGIYNDHYDPNYKPTWGESLAAGISPISWIRSAAEVGAELLPDVQHARDSMQQLREKNPELADQLELKYLGKKLSVEQNVIKLGAAMGEGILSGLPFVKGAGVASTALKVGEIGTNIVTKEGAAVAAANVRKFSKLIGVAKEVGKSASYGALYGGMYGLHQYDADWEKAAESAAWGGALGGMGTGVMQTMKFAAKGAQKIMSPILTEAVEKATSAGKMIKAFTDEHLPAKLQFTVEGGLKKLSRLTGNEELGLIAGTKRAMDAEVASELGGLQQILTEVGAIKVPDGPNFKSLRKQIEKKGFAFEQIGGNSAKMSEATQILEGIGPYSDPAVRAAAIAKDPTVGAFDLIRKTMSASSKELGILDGEKINPDTYFPHKTPLVEAKPKMMRALELADTPAKELSIYEKMSDPKVKEMIDFSTNVKGTYANPVQGYREYYDYLKLKNGDVNLKNNAFLNGLVTRGEFPTIDAAKAALKKDFETESMSLTSRSSSLDFNRQVNLPWYDPNAARVMSEYAVDSVKRIASAKRFGAFDEKLKSILNNIGDKVELGMKAKDLKQQTEDLLRVTFGTQKTDANIEKLSAALRSTQLPKLAFSAIQNLAQTSNTLLASDLGSTLKGIVSAFKDEGAIKTMKSGAVSESFMRQAFEFNVGKGKLSEQFMKYSGFTGSEIINRSIAANTANLWVEKNFSKLLKKYGSNFALAEAEKKGEYWALKELGVDLKTVMERGSLSAEDKAAAAFRFTEKTQFTGSPLDLPYFASHPVGKVALQFKTFAYQQSKLAFGTLIHQAQTGQWKRFARSVVLLNTVFPMGDQVVQNIRSILTQEKVNNKFEDFNSYLQNVFSAGNYGVVADFLHSVEKNKGPEWVLGAAPGDIFDYLHDIAQGTVGGDPDGALRDFSKNVMDNIGIAKPAKNIFFPTKAPGETTLQRLF